MIELPRRKFLTILTGVIAAPAVIKADKLMQVKTIVQPDHLLKPVVQNLMLEEAEPVLVSVTKDYTLGIGRMTSLSRIGDLLRPGLEEAFRDHLNSTDPEVYRRIFAPRSSNKGWLS